MSVLELQEVSRTYGVGAGVVHDPARTLVDLVKWIEANGIDLSDIHLKRPTLEDAFIELTGKSLRE